MLMSDPREAMIPPGGDIQIELFVGGAVRTFTGDNLLVRRFIQGDGEFDHCVHITPDQRLIAFTPTSQAMEELLRLGFPVRVDETIDEATIEHYARVQAEHMDPADLL